MGFHKCNKNWAPSMFKLDGDAPADGEAVVKPFDPNNDQQVEKSVDLDSMEQTLKLVHDFKAEKDSAW